MKKIILQLLLIEAGVSFLAGAFIYQITLAGSYRRQRRRWQLQPEALVLLYSNTMKAQR